MHDSNALFLTPNLRGHQYMRMNTLRHALRLSYFNGAYRSPGDDLLPILTPPSRESPIQILNQIFF